VHGGLADPGPPGDLVERHLQAGLGEGALRRGHDRGTVAGGVDAQGPLGRRSFGHSSTVAQVVDIRHFGATVK
jgi:hypothetical protein